MERRQVTRRLSSRTTAVYKFGFPLLWIVGVGLVTIALWFDWINEPEPTPGEVKWIFIFAWIVGSTIVIWFSRRLRSVHLQGDHLLVSDYLTEIKMPLTELEEISETRYWNPKMITLRVRRGSWYPEQIVFLAPLAFQAPYSDHPVVRDLRRAVSESEQEHERDVGAG